MRSFAAMLAATLLTVSCLPDFVVESGADGAAGASGDASSGGSGGSAGSVAGGGAPSGGSGGTGGDSGPDLCAGKNCLGGACVNGKCQPVVLAAQGLRYGIGFALSDADVYFSNSEPPAIYRCPLAGCGTANEARVEFVPGEQAYDLHVAADHLYWSTNLTPGSLKRCPLADSTNPQVLTSSPYQIVRFRVDGAELFFGDGVWASSCDTTGCALKTTYGKEEGIASRRVDVGQGFVFWATQSSSLWRVPKNDSSKVTQVTGSLTDTSFALDDQRIYLALTQPAPTIASCDLTTCGSGSSPTPLTNATNVSSMTVDGGFLYWAEFGTSLYPSGAIRRMPVGGGAVDTIATEQASPMTLAADANAIYWLNGGVSPPGPGGSLMRWAK